MADIVPVTDDQWAVMEKVVVQGDLSKLSPAERVAYYRSVCESVGLNPLTQPFAYITLNGKLTLYALKGATDQVRATRRIAVTIVSRERLDDVYVVTARATLPDGRTDESIGAVTIAGLKGDALANALMKAETKAKRRVTLSAVGLGMLDESETETIRGARFHPADELDVRNVDTTTGEIIESPAAVVVPSGTSDVQRDIEELVAEARGCQSKGHLRLIGNRAEKLGLLNDPVVLAELQHAKARLVEASQQQELVKA